MRSLAQVRVMWNAAIAALVTTAACVPRIVRWDDPPHAFWFLLTLLGLVSFVMWGFVFGWLPAHAGLDPFRGPEPGRAWWLATLGGVGSAVFVKVALDPTLRRLLPEEYPATPEAWATATLFHLAFVQLFLCFAPFAFFVRLLHDRRLAAGAVVLFGVVLLGSQLASTRAVLPGGFGIGMLAVRVVFGALTVLLLVKGGVPAVLWWAFLQQVRLLPGLGGT